MEVVTLPVSEVQEWENNARIHTRKNLEALKNSLKKYGQTKPILVQKSTMRIIAGNGTYQAICALGWETVECRLLDLSDSDSEALMVADNRIGELSAWDELNLLSALQNIKAQGNLELVGYDDLQFEKMIAFKDRDAFADLEVKDTTPKEKTKPEDFPPPEEKNSPTPSEEETEHAPPSYEDQVNFTIHGFIFSLADVKEIEELRCLIDILKDSSASDRSEVNQKVFESIKDILTQKFMR